VSAPALLRFDYAGPGRRTFALDDRVARLVDGDARTCDALRLDTAALGALPLAALLSPEGVGDALTASVAGNVLVLTPRSPGTDLTEVRVTLGADGLPVAFVIVDGSGNRNEFRFSAWHRATAQPAGFFRPSLPGEQPCEPGTP
jgi:outer membrane lipoprotein-sorting protein